MIPGTCWWSNQIYVRTNAVAALRAFPMTCFVHELIFNHIFRNTRRTTSPVRKERTSFTRTSSFGPTLVRWTSGTARFEATRSRAARAKQCARVHQGFVRTCTVTQTKIAMWPASLQCATTAIPGQESSHSSASDHPSMMSFIVSLISAPISRRFSSDSFW